MKFIKLTISILIIFIILSLTAYAQDDNETCLSCHFDKDLTGFNHKGQEVSMFVTQASLDSSVHNGMNCIDCHSDLEGIKEYPHPEDLKPVNCGNCHDDVEQQYDSSAHGMAIATNPKAPTCTSCHGTHNILPYNNPLSPISPKKLPYTCASCHEKQVLTGDKDVKIINSFNRYMRGVHAQGIAEGIESAASCDDCHGIHDLRKASDSRSKVNKMNLPKTCAKCHNDVYIQYSRGIHGKALAAGILDAPNCADCHGEHEILPINDPKSPINPSNIADYVCGKCHNNPQLVEKFGLGKDQFSSYQDSYHGLAVRNGSLKAANCTSCHRAHDILPASNPASSINPNNITNTCRQCHPKANYAFASSYSHRTASREFNKLNYTVTVIYVIAIVLIIGGMVVHNMIILFRYIIDKKRRQKSEVTVQRFTGSMIYQHFVVTISFSVLVITGFALHYPNVWWVSILRFFGITEASRSVIHRIAAIFLVYISFHHALSLFFTKYGRIQFKHLLPVKDDLRQIIQNVKYHLGKSPEKPKFGFYDYTEKAEYWALVWGTIVMALTGFILWFPTFFTSFLPAWIVKIAETIHFYEAWLATLAIGVFHFFFVVFHPEQYPMSFTWLTGKMSLKEVKEEHPAWYEEIKDELNLDETATKNEERPEPQ